MLCLAVYFLRSSSADINDLASDSPELVDMVKSSAISPRWQWLLLLLLIGIYYSALVSAEFSMFPDRILVERWEIITGTAIPIMLYFVATPLLTLGAWLFTMVYWQQLVTLTRLARHLPLKISQLIRYQQISNPFVRLVIVFSFLSTLFPISLLVPDKVPVEAVVLTSITVGAFLTVCALYLIPVTILRNRIHDLLNQALLTVADQMKDENLTDKEHEQLMTKQMYLESRWEWPLASNIQKIIVFGLLPPAAWVMAAAVENLLF